MRVAIATDTWHPQVNGVVKTLSITADELERLGHRVTIIEPALFDTFPCPTYPEIRLAWLPQRRVDRLLTDFAPDAVHVATEGPVGLAVRTWCARRQLPFTTSYHTQLPEYLRARVPFPVEASYALLRRFHRTAVRTMVATPSIERGLEARGFRNIVRWSRGVDPELFRPQSKTFLSWPRPIAIYVGRVAIEKNIDDFLRIDLPGTKVVVGDGPARRGLEEKYAEAKFVGFKFGADLAQHVAAADVFVFPSRTDTFGLVLLEAMACGVPVAAYPVTGPIDVVQQNVTGKLDENLSRAAHAALSLSPAACRTHALMFTWAAATEQFVANLAPIEPYAGSLSKLRTAMTSSSKSACPSA